VSNVLEVCDGHVGGLPVVMWVLGVSASDMLLITYLQAELVWPTYDRLQELQVSW